MTPQEEKGPAAVFWWLGWIALTILSFFVSCYFWTDFISKNVGSIDKAGVPILWVAAVFGSWMVLLVPLIILMYGKVDKAYEDARISRETALLQKTKSSAGFKSIWVDREKRILGRDLSKKLKTFPEALKKAHLVTATLKDRRKVENVFVLNRKEVLGVYDSDSFSFEAKDVVDMEAADLDALPDFKPEKWLRLDGA